MTDTPEFLAHPQITRRRLLKLAGAGALGGSLAAVAGGIATGMAPGVRAATNSVLCTMVCDSGTSYTRNFNPFSPTARWAAKNCMYEPLMIYNYAQSKLEPWLATESTWGAGNTTLRMQLRRGVTWSDGQPFTAADVAYTFHLMRDNPGLLGSVSGAWDDYLVAVNAPDDHTVEFQFKRAFSPGLYLVANQFIVPQHIWKSAGDPVKFTNPDPVSTGPFTVLSFRPQVYEVHRNPKYWGQITIEGLRIPAFTGNNQISAEVIGGEIDWGGLVASPDKTFVAKDPTHNHYWWPTTTDVCLYLNTTKKPFDDPKFRKAVGAALDRERMIATAIWGKSTPANATGLAEGAFKAWLDPTAVAAGKEWVTYDAAKANQMLDAAGYKRKGGGTRTTPDGQDLKFTAIVPGAYTDWVADNQVIVNNLNEVGIEVELKTISPDSWTTSIYTGEFDMSVDTGTRGATPFDFYRGTMSSATYQPIGKQAPENIHRYKNAQADDLLAKFAATVDTAQQKSLIHQLEALFVQEAPVIPLYGQPDWGLFTTKRITGFPDADNAYAPLSTQTNWPTALLVFPHLKPA